MKVSYENDATKGPGNGIFRCTDASFPDGTYVFSLARASDHLFLGAGDWGTQRAALKPVSQTIENGSLCMSVGTNIVNTLDVQENYRFFLTFPDGSSSSAGLQVRDVAYRTGAQTSALNQPQESTVIPTAAPEPAPAPAPEQAPVPQPDLTMPPRQETRKSPLPIILLVALLLLLAAGGAYLFFRKQESPQAEPPKQEQQATPQESPAGQPPAAPEQKPAEAPQKPQDVPAPAAAAPAAPQNPAPSAEPDRPQQEKPASPAAPAAQPAQQPAAAPSPSEQVAQFFSKPEHTPAQAASLSRSLPRTGKEDQNAIYRLYYYAGENGETSVLVEYAACLDPSLPQWGDLDKDAPAAWALYEKARATRPEAAAAQKNLKTWLEKEANSGNTQAREWLSAIR